MAILGLVSTESTSAERFTNIRRKVFYFYPNGAAPLIGLLSMLKQEDTNDPEYSIYEKRLVLQRTLTTSQAATAGPFRLAADAVTGLDPFIPVVGTTHVIYVADTSQLRIGHVIKIAGLTVSGTAVTQDYKAVVTAIGSAASTTATDRITVRPISFPASATSTGYDNGVTNENVGKEVLIIGSSFAQGITDISRGIYNLPVSVANFCQIFRTPFSITGTQLKTSVKFDETGPYKDMAKEASVYHMEEMEKAFIFGTKLKTTANEATGLPQYFTGGVLSFLENWEAAASPYRGASSSAVTADTDDDKRIIVNSVGTMSHKRYNGFLERVFRVTNNVANEKLVLCGSGFLSVINQMYEARSVLNTNLPMEDTFGMNVVKHETPFGTIYYKSHPLFSQNPTLRFNALFLDIQNLLYRYVQGRDTALLKNRQANDADFRKDEWLSECGLELRFPESNMYLQNVQDFTP